MREVGLAGCVEEEGPRTTTPDAANPGAIDLVNHQFYAVGLHAVGQPAETANSTYCSTETDWAYTAFVIDVFARKIVGWKMASAMATDRYCHDQHRY